MRHANKILVGRSFERPGCRCENNSGMELEKIEWKSVDWMHLAQNRDQWRAVMNMVMNLRVL
jgi:hypothetical protein